MGILWKRTWFAGKLKDWLCPGGICQMSGETRGEESSSLTIVLLILLVLLAGAGGAAWLLLSSGPVRPPQNAPAPTVDVKEAAENPAPAQPKEKAP